jgi:uncharacterized protein YcbX
VHTGAGLALVLWFVLPISTMTVNGTFPGVPGDVTQRTHPRLALARPTFTRDRLRVSAPGLPDLELPLQPAAGVSVEVTVWSDLCEAVWLGDGPARWCSELVGAPVSLVYMPELTIRVASSAYAPEGARVSFADAFPFLLLSEESLADLNRRLASPLPMNRFRPNLVIRGGGPFHEDGLDHFRIGKLGLRAVKPCDRCVVTTVDQDTGEQGREPLRTLATYRRRGGEVYFGQNVVHQRPGSLCVGARLTGNW